MQLNKVSSAVIKLNDLTKNNQNQKFWQNYNLMAKISNSKCCFVGTLFSWEPVKFWWGSMFLLFEVFQRQNVLILFLFFNESFLSVNGYRIFQYYSWGV